MAKRPISLGVDWFLPDGKGGFRKRRFATTTVADNDLLRAYAERGITFDECMAIIAYPSTEVLTVLHGFIDAGYGEVLMAKLVG